MRRKPFNSSGWPPLLQQLGIVNKRKHAGTIKASAIVIHTMVRNYTYEIYMYNVSKDIWENIGTYKFIGEDALNYQFEEVESKLSNIEFKTITLPKTMDDRYFFRAASEYDKEP
jgi:hypothetical protein